MPDTLPVYAPLQEFGYDSNIKTPYEVNWGNEWMESCGRVKIIM